MTTPETRTHVPLGISESRESRHERANEKSLLKNLLLQNRQQDHLSKIVEILSSQVVLFSLKAIIV